MNESVEVARGIVMPFFPMRPASGSPIRTTKQVEHVIDEIGGSNWLIQPKAGGMRACLAIVDKRVWVQNRHGRWLEKPLKREEDFLKLRNRTCFDGEIIDDEFHPFECLAVNGKSLLMHPAVEREAVAEQLVRLIGHRWLFHTPSKKFLVATRKNLPQWEGVVMKGYMSVYIPQATARQQAGTWIKCKW